MRESLESLLEASQTHGRDWLVSKLVLELTEREKERERLVEENARWKVAMTYAGKHLVQGKGREGLGLLREMVSSMPMEKVRQYGEQLRVKLPLPTYQWDEGTKP